MRWRIDEGTPARLLAVVALLNFALLVAELAFNVLSAGIPW